MSRIFKPEPEFQELYRQRKERGEVDLQELLDDGRVSLDHLHELGLVKGVERYNTAKLYDYCLTEKGRELIVYVNHIERFMIQKNNLPVLLDMIEKHPFSGITKKP